MSSVAVEVSPVVAGMVSVATPSVARQVSLEPEAATQLGSPLAPPKSFLPSPSLSMPSEHTGQFAPGHTVVSLSSLGLSQPGSFGKSFTFANGAGAVGLLLMPSLHS